MYLLLALEDGQGLRGILTFESGYAMLCYAMLGRVNVLIV